MINTGCFPSGVNCSMYERRLTNRYVTLVVIGRDSTGCFPSGVNCSMYERRPHKQVRNTGGDRAR